MKRFTLLLLSFLLIFSFTFSAVAADVSMAGTGDKYVIISDGWAYEKVNAYGYEIDEYVGSDTEVSLPWSFAREYVTTIGDYAFLENKTVEKVDTTSVLEAIGKYAFSDCTALSDITLYESVTKLGEGCFYRDKALRNINLEDTAITEVPELCFAFSGLSEVALPESCVSIGELAFYNGELTKIIIPDSVTEIADNAFIGCDNLVIYALSDSYAIEYAQKHGIDYVLTDPVPYTFILGDANGDGEILIQDATLVQRVLSQMVSDDDGMIALRVLGGEGQLTIADATEIQRYLAKMNVSKPIGTEMTVMK